MRRISLLVLWPIALAAQTAKPPEFSAIEGRVVNAVTGEPVAKASLMLVHTDGDRTHNYSGTSDAAGKFAIRNIDPGKYRLRATRNGFVTLEYGARRSQKSGTVLSLEAGPGMKDVEVRLTPQGVITGRVLDADGDPLLDARVQLLRSQYVNGKKMLATVRVTSTNDLGEYRWYGLDPDRYYLYAEEWTDSPPSTEGEQYVPLYYPGAGDASGAAPLAVAAGAQVRAADMMLRKARTVSVKGKVVVELPGAQGMPEVRLSRAAGHNDTTGTYRAPAAKVNAAGEFEIDGITPGSYTVSASIGRGRLSFGGWTTIDVGGVNLEHVVVTIPAMLTVIGRVRVEGDEKVDLRGAEARLTVDGPNGTSVAERTRVQPDGSFRMNDVSPRRYRASLRGLPDGCYVKAVRIGELDVTYTGLDPAGGVLDIVVSPKAGVVSGVVKGEGGNTVVLVPREKERGGIESYYHQTTTDQFGRFTFLSVAPGEYKVFAWEDVEATAWMDPEFLKPVEDKGEAVTVAESGTPTVQVAVIPAQQ